LSSEDVTKVEGEEEVIANLMGSTNDLATDTPRSGLDPGDPGK